MSEVPQDLNVLMSLDPLELTRQDRDAIIAYQRQNRAQREAGVRTRKPKEEGPKLNIKDLLSQTPKPAAKPGSTIKRRL